LGPEDLHRALQGLPQLTHPNLIVGTDRVEDAGVYKLTEEIAIVQTLDFFTPVVDDPYVFGQIAATNSLSDVYAMGGKPLTAMNIVCFPVKTMDISVMHRMLLGGIDKMREAEVVLVGGHSVDDQELKYGLSVTGTIHPARVLRKEGSRPGNQLILTKPLGTGIINTAAKGDQASPEAIARVVKSMTTLNRQASEIMLEVGVDACTDVTGFGLLGHACEMIEDTLQGMRIFAGKVPLFPDTLKLATMGLVPGGLYRNRDFRKGRVHFAPGIDENLADILFDPQTSGGLLISVSGEKSSLLLQKMHQAGIEDAAVIGEITDQHPGEIEVRA
jgi:selenide, water dikinase